jgi:hypothetical protein
MRHLNAINRGPILWGTDISMMAMPELCMRGIYCIAKHYKYPNIKCHMVLVRFGAIFFLHIWCALWCVNQTRQWKIRWKKPFAIAMYYPFVDGCSMLFLFPSHIWLGPSCAPRDLVLRSILFVPRLSVWSGDSEDEEQFVPAQWTLVQCSYQL